MSEPNSFPAFEFRSPLKEGRRVDLSERDDLVLTLPRELLDILQRTLGNNAFDPTLLEQEYEWACEVGMRHAGFWGSWSISFPFFERQGLASISIIEAMLPENAPTSEKLRIERAIKQAEARLKSFWDVSKGYLGWLMTSKEFVEEHDQLVEKYGDALDDRGFRVISQPIMRPAAKGSAPEADLLAFCVKWRLSRLAAPNLPIPLGPQTPVPAPILALGDQNQCGNFFFMPDTFPIPSRDELRSILEDARRRSAQDAAHLADWNKIVNARNSAKNEIARFAKFFDLQHYRRILQQRHPGAIEHRINKLEQAFADYLHVKQSTIHADMQAIGKRLGMKWEQRRCRFDFVVAQSTLSTTAKPGGRKPR